MDAYTDYEPIEVDEDALPEFTIEEVAKHCSEDNLWIIIYDRVYDVS